MISKFIETCKQNFKKDAFRYLKNNKLITKTYSELLDDVYRFCSLFQKWSLKEEDKVILFIKPSYKLYTLMIAGMMYGLNIVVIDSFKDKAKIKKMLEISQAQFVFVDSISVFVSDLIFPKLKKINISKYYKCSNTTYKYKNNENLKILTTFTSGTTGIPKIINRSFIDMKYQIKLLNKNYSVNNCEVVICLLPIYVLFSLLNGNTTCIINKINNKNINKLNATIMLGKISKVLKVKEKIQKIKKLYLGGAYIYKKEAKQILDNFPNACVLYTYGASEGVVIGVNDLNDFYTNQRYKLVNGLNVEINNSINNIGEICISGKSIIGVNKKHCTGDIGYIDNNYLYIVGRLKYSSLDNTFYNYVNDQLLRDKYNIDNIFSIWYHNRSYNFTSTKTTIDDLIYVKKMPYDLKHNTKVDYTKLIEKYINN